MVHHCPVSIDNSCHYDSQGYGGRRDALFDDGMQDDVW